MRISAVMRRFAPVAVLGLATMVSGCSTFSLGGAHESPGYGTDGVRAFQRGDYTTARDIFAEEHKTNPDDPYALSNLADAYFALQDRDNSVSLYQQVVAKYKTEAADRTTAGTKDSSFAQHACERLKMMQVTDPGCPS